VRCVFLIGCGKRGSGCWTTAGDGGCCSLHHLRLHCPELSLLVLLLLGQLRGHVLCNVLLLKQLPPEPGVFLLEHG
jgi:hypothetical protein